MTLFYGNFAFCQFTGESSSSGLDSPVRYEATDSIVADIPNEIVRLYGKANVKYQDIDLKADLIEIDLKTNEVIAKYTLDSLGNPQGKPIFSSAGEESTCEYIKYNFETKKGFVKEIRLQQGEGHIHMAESKVHPNEHIHFRNGKFTTCDREDPHFNFRLTRAIIVPEKRVVTGPVYLEVLHVPLPIAAPFGFFPNTESKKAGLIIPRLANNNQFGFGLEDIGYYIPLGQNWETKFYGSIFTTGRWAAQNITNYLVKYKYRGGVSVRFEQFRGKFYDTNISNKWTLGWNHTQDPKSHPSLRFTSNINFVSDNNAQTSLDAINPNFFNNTFNSSIKVDKTWRLGQFKGTSGIQTSLQQNSSSQNYTLELPRFNLSVSRFDLGVLRKSKIGEKWYEKINVTYNVNARNSIVAGDSIFNFNNIDQVANSARNGVIHEAVVRSNLRLFGGRFVFTPSSTYRDFWNFQSEDRVWNPITQQVDTTEFRGFRSSRDLAIAGNLSSNFFGYYKFKGKAQTKFRHVATPNINFTYRPDIGIHEEIQVDTLGNLSYYSPFNQSLYRERAQGSSGTISFALNNTLEMKRRTKNDTINQTFKSYKLVDAFSINGGYDFLRDSLQLSNLSLAFRTSRFFNIFSFQSNGSFSPYAWDNITGVSNSDFAFSNGQGLGRFQNARGVLNANFTNKKGRKKQQENEDNAEGDANATAIVTDPKFIDFDIPWTVNLSYNITYTRLSSVNLVSELVDTFNLMQTIDANGNVNFGKKWKLDYSVRYDIQQAELNEFTLSLWRDLHCWKTSINYVQRGPFFNSEIPDFRPNWSILFKIGVKASLFQDIKYDHRFQNPFPL